VKTADAIVCGAGVIGCAIARELAGDGASVTVLERGCPGDEASGAAAGLLTIQSDYSSDTPFARFCRHSGALYPALVASLADETGIDVPFTVCGTLRVASDAEDARAMKELAAWQESVPWTIERVSGDRLRLLSGGALSPRFHEGQYFCDEAVVDNRELVRALRVSAERRGARFRTGCPALSVTVENGACTGVATPEGGLRAGAVIDAAGAWAAFDPALSFPIPIRPVRGQIVELSADEGPPPCVLSCGGFYVAPRERGRILLGSTVEEAGFEKAVIAEAVAGLITRAVALAPRLSRARFVAAWAGLRPAAPDGLPILGETPLAGFFLATGHFRNGILLAPATARLLADILSGKAPAFDLEPFALERFERAPGFDSPLQRETRLVRSPNARKRKDLKLGYRE
jgi:glycine oxidase